MGFVRALDCAARFAGARVGAAAAPAAEPLPRRTPAVRAATSLLAVRRRGQALRRPGGGERRQLRRARRRDRRPDRAQRRRQVDAVQPLTGTAPMTAARCAFLGHDVTGMAQREVARLGMARTFQHVKLRPQMSLLDNVALGAHGRTRSGLLAAGLRLDRARGATDLRRSATPARPHRPGGSRRTSWPAACRWARSALLEIARALAADPVLLVLDEPAAGLRRQEKQALGDLLRKLRGEGVTILIVEHDMDFVMKLVDRLVVMNFGSKLVEGAPAAVRADRAGAGGLPRQRDGRRPATRRQRRWPRAERAHDGGDARDRRPARRPTARSMRCAACRCRCRPGQIVSVIGPNGAGKTTLLAAAMGLLPSQGHAALRGRGPARPRRRGARRARPVPGAREARAVRRADGARQPAARRLRPAPRRRCAAQPARRRATRASRAWPSGARSAPTRCRAASGRCWRSAAR